MKHSDPAVSVVIPAYNCDRYIADAIESVLRQTRRADQIIVIDDGSTDGTDVVIRQYEDRVSYVRQQTGPSGAAAARNRGVALARGDFIAFIDADDIWLADKLRQQLDLLLTNPALDAVFCHIEIFHERGADEGQSADNNRKSLPGYLPSSILIRKEALHRTGLFDESYQAGEFIDWYARATERGLRFGLTSAVLVRRRIHGFNLGIVKQHLYGREYLRLVKSALDRRRQAKAS